MTRISITVPSALHEQLQYEAKLKKTSVSDLIRTLVSKEFEFEKMKKLEKTYAALWSMVGAGKSDETDISEKIDEILYGENGAWRGTSDDK